MQDDKNAEKSDNGFVWQDREGYIFRAGYKPPVKTDVLFLYYIMFCSQKNGWKEELSLTRYNILKGCGIIPGKTWFKRLEDSLKRWKMIGIEYKGTFYDEKSYKTMNFGIIDSWSIEEDSKILKVRFSLEWLLKIKESNFFKMINFEDIKKLQSPLVTRLYEILIKSFQGRDRWEIDALKLASKIPMKEKYISHIIIKIKTAVNKINNDSELKISVELKRQGRGKAIFIFSETDKEENKDKDNGFKVNTDNLMNILVILPEREREKKSVKDLISVWLEEKDIDYVISNIKYTNKNCKENEKYKGYLVNALKKDWGIELREHEEAIEKVKLKRKKEEEDREQQRNEEHAKKEQLTKYESYIINECNCFYDKLTKQEKKDIDDVIMKDLNSPFLRDNKSAYEMVYEGKKIEILKNMSKSIVSFENFCKNKYKE
jgi:hypothetical protein